MAPRRQPVPRRRQAPERNQIGVLVESQKRKRLLLCNGRTYRQNNQNREANSINWRCVMQGLCSATANTEWFDLNTAPIGLEVRVAERKPHSHGVDQGENEVQTVRRNLRQRAESEPNVAPSLLVQEVLNEVEDEEVLMRIAERQTLVRAVHRAQTRTRPRNPRNIDELVIVPPYSTTLGGEPFVQLDVVEDGIRVVMLYTVEGELKVVISWVLYDNNNNNNKLGFSCV